MAERIISEDWYRQPLTHQPKHGMIHTMKRSFHTVVPLAICAATLGLLYVAVWLFSLSSTMADTAGVVLVVGLVGFATAAYAAFGHTTLGRS